tara:strand:- start:366 stop:623 length:258 start_codon:yes stop_codon:yes gene_type:complete
MTLDDNLDTDDNNPQRDHKLTNGDIHNTFYIDMCRMYESRLRYYQENLGKKTEFDTKITKSFIENYEKAYEHFRRRNSYKGIKPF